MPVDQLQEIQGLYGPFTLSERVIQKIWLRQDFSKDALRTTSGKVLEVKDPGRWNLQEGPDFKEARLVLDGEEVQGDVEIHFNVADWELHDHQNNPNFDRVVLHVVLHPSRNDTPIVRTTRRDIPETLYLLPILEEDLETYASEEALLALEQVDDLEWVARFLEHPLAERLQVIREQAELRWAQKLHYASKRLSGSDWTEACHQFCLEVLGYARNRAPMSRIALEHPLSDFQQNALTAEELFAEQGSAWRLSGLRPANHPRLRLAQYLEIVKQRPDWPDRLAWAFKAFPSAANEICDSSASAFRKRVGLNQLQEGISGAVFNDSISNRRLNTMICDAFLPLATAAGLIEGKFYWMHWSPGDAPDGLRRFLKHAQITDRTHPQSNGSNQGALALFLSRGRHMMKN
jgi:DNA-binding Lrp family transcriptional regulator